MTTELWHDDKLGTKDVATYLTNFLEKRFQASKSAGYYESLVLNINAEWGFGKTYLLQNWHKYVATNHPALYFNAWENDFSEVPLIAFISEIDRALSPYFENTKTASTLKKAVQIAKKLVKPSLPFLLTVLVRKLTGMSGEEIHGLLTTAGDETSDGVASKSAATNEPKSNIDKVISTVLTKAAEEALKEHSTTSKAIAEFKANLIKLTEQIEKNNPSLQLPMFIFIDELDRCRPTYAIELLENIKHLFGVRGVYFVIATDSKQLSHSIKAVYGAEFSADRYLRRFFDQEYTPPKPNHYQFASFLLSKYGLIGDNKIFVPLTADLYQGHDLATVLFSKLSEYFDLGLRDQEQCCAVLDAVRLTIGDEKLHLGYALFLIMLRQKYYGVFESYERGRSYDSIRDKLRAHVNHPIHLNRYKKIDDFNSRPDAVLIEQCIGMFANYAHMPRKDLGRQNPADSIEEATMRFLVSRNVDEPMQNYINLVKQAGQLITR